MKRTNVNSKTKTSADDGVIYLGTEQPETCRWCGMRTIFDELDDGTQQHECTACQAHYLVEFA